MQAAQTAAAQQRAQVLRQIDADRLGMAKACAAKFDVKTAPDNTLADLASLYTEAAQPDMAKAALNRAMLALKTMPESDRATVLLLAIQTGLREPITAERNAGLENYVNSVDKLSDAVLDQKFSAHTAMNNYYAMTTSMAASSSTPRGSSTPQRSSRQSSARNTDRPCWAPTSTWPRPGPARA